MAFSVASAPPLVKKDIVRSPGATSASSAGEPGAGLVGHRRRRRAQASRLRRDGLGDARMLVAQVRVDDQRAEVEVATSVVVPEMAALAAGDGSGRIFDCVDHECTTCALSRARISSALSCRAIESRVVVIGGHGSSAGIRALRGRAFVPAACRRDGSQVRQDDGAAGVARGPVVVRSSAAAGLRRRAGGYLSQSCFTRSVSSLRTAGHVGDPLARGRPARAARSAFRPSIAAGDVAVAEHQPLVDAVVDQRRVAHGAPRDVLVVRVVPREVLLAHLGLKSVRYQLCRPTR